MWKWSCCYIVQLTQNCSRYIRAPTWSDQLGALVFSIHSTTTVQLLVVSRRSTLNDVHSTTWKFKLGGVRLHAIKTWGCRICVMSQCVCMCVYECVCVGGVPLMSSMLHRWEIYSTWSEQQFLCLTWTDHRSVCAQWYWHAARDGWTVMRDEGPWFWAVPSPLSAA